MHPRRAATVIEAIITLVIVLIIGVMLVTAFKAINTAQNERSEKVYQAWCKVNYRTDITYEEWRALWRRGMLPTVVNLPQPQTKKE